MNFRRHRRTVLSLWMVLNITWLAVLFVSDVPAWTLAIWIAATVGAIAALAARKDRQRAG